MEKKQCFEPSEDGLYYLDINARKNDETLLINTVSNNKCKFTKTDVIRVQAARRLQNIIGRPPMRNYLDIIKNQLLPNNTVTIQDAINAELIFGPNLGSIKGKTPISTPPSADMQNIDLPPDILDLYRNVKIS